MEPSSYEAVVIGAGFAGLGAAVHLRQRGVENFVVLEKAPEVGGTWEVNTYPGCCCDVPTELYSFSFQLNPEWSRLFAPQAEILAYLKRCVGQYDLASKLRLGVEVTGLRFNESTERWAISLSTGETLSARFVISGMGGLSTPATPHLPGLETFQGKVFHSQRWDHQYPLEGKRVAVVGTGASAIQIVPAIAPKVGSLTLLQRTPPWVMPRLDRPYSAAKRFVFRHIPGVQRLFRWARYWARELTMLLFLNPRLLKFGERIAKKHLAAQVKDEQLRRTVTPNYTIGCKRILLSDDYYPALQRDNVQVVPHGAATVEPDALIDSTGTRHPVDCIVLATGFKTTDPIPFEVVGRGGFTLREAWAGGMTSHLGTMVHGFPNLFLLVGPNTGIGHTSLVFMIECQLNYVADTVDCARKNGWSTVEVKQEVQANDEQRIAARSAHSVWKAGGCTSWYLDEHGRNTTVWPDFTFRFWWLTHRFVPEHHLIGTASHPALPLHEATTHE